MRRYIPSKCFHNFLEERYGIQIYDGYIVIVYVAVNKRNCAYTLSVYDNNL